MIRRMKVTVATPSVITICIIPGMSGRLVSVNIYGVVKLL